MQISERYNAKADMSRRQLPIMVGLTPTSSTNGLAAQRGFLLIEPKTHGRHVVSGALLDRQVGRVYQVHHIDDLFCVDGRPPEHQSPCRLVIWVSCPLF